MDPATGELYAGPFGKYQRIFSVFSYGLYQTVFYGSIFLVCYAILTFNFTILLVMGIISLIQAPVRRCEPYVQWMKKFITPLRYFSKFETVFEEPIPDDEKCFFGVHPHAVFALGLLANMNLRNDSFSRMVGLSSRFMLNFPIVGLLLKLWGVQAVNNASLIRLMKAGKNIGILPGGFEEATLTTPKELRIFINKRKGFIKYCLQYNYTIYPVVVLNEHRCFHTFDYFLSLRLFFNKLKFPGVVYFHQFSGLFVPINVEMFTIVGKGIKNQKWKEGYQPTQDDIDQTHARYIEEIKRVYAKYQQKNDGVPLAIY